jgi:rhamnosyltransferase
LKVSVALLTKNGGEVLRKCLDALCSQRFASAFEILAIDSGSRDGTAELLRGNPQVTFTALAPGDFQHGRTRNLAMRQAQGELVAFLTQDAVPADDLWLANLVAFMDAHPQVAGAFGHQVPHAGADPLEAFEVRGHFDSFRNHPAVFTAAPAGSPPESDAQRVRRHFFSNVNSCIRRQAWERMPFPEIDFGEDQAWAAVVQSAGWATGYAEHAVVRHSHEYGPMELFRRRYDEARFMRRQFGFHLAPDWRGALQMAREHAALFRSHLATLPGGQGDHAWLQANRRAWASSLGRYAGTRLADRDGLLHRWLSLAERHRREKGPGSHLVP